MHTPVLLQEVVEILGPKPGAFFIDGTIGGGGHARALLKRLEPGGSLLGIDRDAVAVNNLQTLASEFPAMRKVIICRANYTQLAELLKKYELPGADGLLLDLGISSDQLDGEVKGFAGRGFSFRRDEELDMRFDTGAKPVHEVLRELSAQRLADVIKEYGEERYAKEIAVAIKSAGTIAPIMTTGRLAQVIASAVPKSYENGRIHPATRTFQALRIYANSELEHLSGMFEVLPRIVKSGGRVAIISFHSLEDRIVKDHFRRMTKEGRAQILTKKPIMASGQELFANPRSRSAKLRAIELL
ncbi:MAG: 16S rRNA (cytosine(1402)-N(4))-methyltransferase RsmH [bacterium]|nr:16S rRNA (cytosine(1402)-N(4))-methyltransferase RsmH [bacterium]